MDGNHQLHKHNHALTGTLCHTQPHTLSIRGDTPNTCTERLPFTPTKHPPATVHLFYSSHPLSLRIPFLRLPSSITPSVSPPPCPSLSPLPPHPESLASFLYLSSHIPSFSPTRVLSPGRLQMVLNGRRSECNCFVNNSTDTR